MISIFKKIVALSLLVSGISVWGAPITFNYTGASQIYTVPPGVTSIQIEAWGAQGQALTIDDFGGSIGGLGGYAKGELAVIPGQVLNVYVGGTGADGVAGYNGGALGGVGAPSTGAGGNAGSGGGASDVRVAGTALINRVIVAGGGGGGSRDYVNGTCVPCGQGGNGGAGGGLTGVDGADPGSTASSGGPYFNPGSGGKGGTPLAGGLGGTGTGVNGNPGILGIGGVGINGDQGVASGGGGGGYYGGGSGAGAPNGSGASAGAGAGGSSYIGGVTSGVTTIGLKAGNGSILITVLTTAPNSIPSLNIYGLILMSTMLMIVARRRKKSSF